MGCGASRGGGAEAPYDVGELTVEQRAEREAEAGRVAVSAYVGHLLLGDDKFRGMLGQMVDPAAADAERAEMYIECRERLAGYCSPYIENPFLQLFRSKLAAAQIERFLGLEMDAGRLAEAIVRTIKVYPHLVFYPDADLPEEARREDVEEIFRRLFDKTPLETLTEAHTEALREEKEEAKQRKAVADEPAPPRLKGNQKRPKDEAAFFTAEQRAAARLESLVGDQSANKAQQKANQRLAKEGPRVLHHGGGGDSTADAVIVVPPEPGWGLEEGGAVNVDKFEAEMARYIDAKNQARVAEQARRSRTAAAEEAERRGRVQQLQEEQAVARQLTSKQRWKGAGQRLIEAEREFHRPDIRGARERARRKQAAAQPGAAAAAALAVAAPDGSSRAPAVAKGVGKPVRATGPRVLGLDERNHAVWAAGRGTTRITFAVDEQLDNSRYKLSHSSKRPQRKAAAPDGTRGGRVQQQDGQPSAPLRADADQRWFEMTFDGAGSLGISCAHCGPFMEEVYVQAVQKGSLAAQQGLQPGCTLRCVACVFIMKCLPWHHPLVALALCVHAWWVGAGRVAVCGVGAARMLPWWWRRADQRCCGGVASRSITQSSRRGDEVSGWTLGQVVQRMVELGRPVTLTFEPPPDLSSAEGGNGGDGGGGGGGGVAAGRAPAGMQEAALQRERQERERRELARLLEQGERPEIAAARAAAAVEAAAAAPPQSSGDGDGEGTDTPEGEAQEVGCLAGAGSEQEAQSTSSEQEQGQEEEDGDSAQEPSEDAERVEADGLAQKRSKRSAKPSIFKDQAQAKAAKAERQEALVADKARRRERGKKRRRRRKEKQRITMLEAEVLASEYRVGDDYSAFGRLWKAVQKQPGCPDYKKFKQWVQLQQEGEDL